MLAGISLRLAVMAMALCSKLVKHIPETLKVAFVGLLHLLFKFQTTLLRKVISKWSFRKTNLFFSYQLNNRI